VDALLPIDTTALRNRVAALGLRQWWLAEQLGVDRRTVLRWINGQVAQAIEQALAEYAAMGIAESPNERLAACAWRLLGRTDAALAAAERAVALAEAFPLERAPAAAELALCRAARVAA
jgi:hypothetical protein